MKISQIEASLSQGRLFQKKWLVAIYTFIAVAVLSILFGVILIIANYVFDMGEELDFIFSMVFLILFVVLLLIVLILVLIKNQKTKKLVIMWVQDAVLLKAYTKKLDSFNTELPFLILPEQTLLEVHFVYSDKKQSQISKGAMIGGKKQKGHHKIFSKYADKEIDILYSPKYDQVLILKAKRLK